MLPHPGTPRFLTLILSAVTPLAHSPHHHYHHHRRRHRRPFAFSVVQRVSAESPQTSVFQAPEDRSLTRYPLSPASLYLPKGIERAENLNSLLGLLIPRIDAEFRAQPFALIPSSLLPSIRDLHLRSSARPFESSFVRPAARRDPHGRGRAGKSAVSIGTVRLVTRSELRPSIERASERASGNGYRRGD